MVIFFRLTHRNLEIKALLQIYVLYFRTATAAWTRSFKLTKRSKSWQTSTKDRVEVEEVITTAKEDTEVIDLS
jgi:hypothetical protein